MTKRLIWADSLRGILIVLVVLGHAIQAQLGDDCFNDHLWNYIYSFHMAAFMAVSGWLSCRVGSQMNRSGGGRLTTVYRRIQQLLIPLFLWSVLKFITLKVSPSNEVFNVFHPDPYYWFLWALFCIQTFFIIGDWLSEFIKLKQYVAIASVWVLLVLLMLVLNVRILGFQYIAYYFAFYIIGYYLHKYESLLIKNKVFLLLLMLVWPVLAWFWDMHELPLSILPLTGGLLQYAYRFVTALLAVYVLINATPMLLDSGKK
ncbi:acyltransferase family protein [Prevotella sp. E2-28]|uniref:acyltransferase family protein n=1 Tax=Prevotella sp. E2-28 TaxID=2913620 RepID=UPI001EDABF91|nr:acyltransferase family protein [Prevotella sp. E2-28]UKK54781.1 acyltransferase family protein [Prevotella sp. E2-28]